MRTKQKFIQQTVDGRPYVSFEQWKIKLSQQDRFELQQAERRQFAYRDQAIARGDMYIDSTDGSYVWKDKETAQRGKMTDDVWYDYFERWRRECGISESSVLQNESES